MTLQPGAELDRMVAEKVMGWTPRNDHNDRWWYGAGAEDGRHISGVEVFADGRNISFQPSANIAHAWEVVERLAPMVGDFKAGDGFFHLTYGQFAEHSKGDGCLPGECPESDDDDKDPAPWSAHLHLGCIGADGGCPLHWQHGSKFCARGATAPHAICLAALRAVANNPP